MLFKAIKSLKNFYFKLKILKTKDFKSQNSNIKGQFLAKQQVFDTMVKIDQGEKRFDLWPGICLAPY